MMNSKVKDIERVVKENGYRLTPSRRTIIRIFDTTNAHLKAEEIYMLAREERVGLATVYRTLDMFKRIGIIKEISIEGERYYELRLFSEKKLHLHFQCTACGKIKEYSDFALIKSMLEQKEFIEKAYGECIEDITSVLSGVCSDCSKSE